MPRRPERTDGDSLDVRIGDVVLYEGRRHVLRGLDPLGVAEPLALLEADGQEIRVPLASIHAAPDSLRRGEQ